MPGKKKFVIKPFRPNVQMDAKAANKIWMALRSAIDEIHNKNASSLSFEELYRNAYNLVLHKHGELLYQGVYTTVMEHLTKVAHGVLRTSSELLLKKLSETWNDHHHTMVMIRDILMYMDRTYVMQKKKIPVYDRGLLIFRDIITRHPQVKDRLRTIMLDNIEKERRGEIIDRVLLKSTLSMLMHLGIKSREVYELDFERHFLQQTALFYQRESQEYMAENSCPDYLQKADSRLREEADRVAHYLDASTEPKLRDIIETELIKKHAKALVEMEQSGCVSMFKHDKSEDLHRMYVLFSRVPATLNYVRDCMSSHVKETGSALVKDTERIKDPVSFIQGLLDMRDKYDNLVESAFEGDKMFEKALKEAFEIFINEDARPARYLSLYIDDMLKKKLAGLTEDMIEAQLDKVIVIFRYLSDKDVFESYYKQHLAKRLLGNRCVSDDAERTMITKLKTECGYQFTSKLEGMFKDMRISKESNEQFRKGRHGRAKVELSVHVLTTGFWPNQSVPPCILPPEITQCCDQFKTFYLEKHTGRRLSWQTNMGTADVKFTLADGKRKELCMTTYQMCILLLYNGADQMTFADMKAKTQIPTNDLKRHLVSLCMPKCRLLIKVSKGKAIKDTDGFKFNAQFKSKFFRVKVPLVSLRPKASKAEVPAPVEEDRRHLIEAAVVRIMKARLTLDHNSLIAEVSRQLNPRFRPTPQQIKKRVESLMEREYLERNKDNRKLYHYLA